MPLDPCIVSFQENVRINLRKPIVDQLQRRRLFHRDGREKGNPVELKKIIERNSSLRVNFGWAFESSYHYQIIMNGVAEEVTPLFNEHAGLMTTDGTCSWLGFVPHNVYDREVYEDLSVYSLILFNNDIIDFQTKVVEYVCNHKIFKQHAITRDDQYRFSSFKELRRDRDALEDAYHYYMDAVHEISLINAISRDMLEEQIGCHFLYHPDLFFELLEFSILKGEIYG